MAGTRYIFALLIALLSVPCAFAGDREYRAALLIGNKDYLRSPLNNPVNDVNALAATLTDLGFDVTKLENADKTAMSEAVRDFSSRLRDRHGIGVFYYAGHAVQVGGANYLIPIGADGELREYQLRSKTIHAQWVLDELDSANNRVSIVILDACRDNPFFIGERGLRSGLAAMESSSSNGMVIAYPTAVNRVASDGRGRHGVYAKHLLAELARPGLKIEDVFKRVRAGVIADTDAAQVPWTHYSFSGDFYFNPATAANPLPAPAGADAVDVATDSKKLWDEAMSANKRDLYELYLKLYPNGKYRKLARIRLDKLRSASTELDLRVDLSP